MTLNQNTQYFVEPHFLTATAPIYLGKHKPMSSETHPVAEVAESILAFYANNPSQIPKRPISYQDFKARNETLFVNEKNLSTKQIERANFSGQLKFIAKNSESEVPNIPYRFEGIKLDESVAYDKDLSGPHTPNTSHSFKAWTDTYFIPSTGEVLEFDFQLDSHSNSTSWPITHVKNLNCTDIRKAKTLKDYLKF